MHAPGGHMVQQRVGCAIVHLADGDAMSFQVSDLFLGGDGWPSIIGPIPRSKEIFGHLLGLTKKYVHNQ